jgi:hypothetical protein
MFIDRIGNIVQRLLEKLHLSPPSEILYIGGSETLPPPLDRKEEAELIGIFASLFILPEDLKTPASISRI